MNSTRMFAVTARSLAGRLFKPVGGANRICEMSSTSSGRGGRGFSRFTSAQEHEHDYNRSDHDDEDADDDNWVTASNRGPSDYNNRGDRNTQRGRGSFNQTRGGQTRGGRGRGAGRPSYNSYGSERGGYGGGGDRGGRTMEYESQEWEERDDFYPDRLSTHQLRSADRYQKNWSELQPRNLNLENKLYKMDAAKGEINFDSYKDIPVEMTGDNVPESVSSFEEANLGEILDNNVDLMGMKQPTPVQIHSTNIVKNKRDLMACAQTGSGKTAAFLIPILSNLFEEGPPAELKTSHSQQVRPLVLILSPTRELASQIFESAQQLCYRSCVRPYVVYGGSNINTSIKELNLGVELLVATPGRLIDLLNRGELSLDMVKYMVLDEADRMLDMGFEPVIREIVEDYNMGSSDSRQTLMFSATFPKPIQLLARDFMKDYVFLTVGRVGSTCNNISQNLLQMGDQQKVAKLVDILTEESEDRILVFVKTKAAADGIESLLTRRGLSAVSIHGGKSQRLRESALKKFRSGAKNVMVATEVASRGLDIPLISHVINFDMPDSIDNYVHRIGRTGRMGNKGKATSFFTNTDWSISHDLTELLEESGQEVPQFLAQRHKSAGVTQHQYGDNSYKERMLAKQGRGRFGGRDIRQGGNRRHLSTDSGYQGL